MTPKTMMTPLKRAKTSFRFCTRQALPILTGHKARDLRELLAYLKDAPDAVIYEHTHGFLQQYQFMVPQPPNEFAHWVGSVVQEERLGEKLAAIDTIRYHTLGDLRQAFR